VISDNHFGISDDHFSIAHFEKFLHNLGQYQQNIHNDTNQVLLRGNGLKDVISICEEILKPKAVHRHSLK